MKEKEFQDLVIRRLNKIEAIVTATYEAQEKEFRLATEWLRVIAGFSDFLTQLMTELGEGLAARLRFRTPKPFERSPLLERETAGSYSDRLALAIHNVEEQSREDIARLNGDEMDDRFIN